MIQSMPAVPTPDGFRKMLVALDYLDDLSDIFENTSFNPNIVSKGDLFTSIQEEINTLTDDKYVEHINLVLPATYATRIENCAGYNFKLIRVNRLADIGDERP